MGRVVKNAAIERIAKQLRKKMHEGRREQLGIVFAGGKKPFEHQPKRRGKLVDLGHRKRIALGYVHRCRANSFGKSRERVDESR